MLHLVHLPCNRIMYGGNTQFKHMAELLFMLILTATEMANFYAHLV